MVPDCCGVLLSLPQVETIKLIRGLRRLIAEAGRSDVAYLESRLTEFNKRLFEWSSRFNANYNLHFAEAIENYRLSIWSMTTEKTPQVHSDLWSLEAIPRRGVKTSDDATKIVEALQRLFIYLDLSTPKPEEK
jgi:hypothetical protein